MSRIGTARTWGDRVMGYNIRFSRNRRAIKVRLSVNLPRLMLAQMNRALLLLLQDAPMTPHIVIVNIIADNQPILPRDDVADILTFVGAANLGTVLLCCSADNPLRASFMRACQQSGVACLGTQAVDDHLTPLDLLAPTQSS